MPAKLVDGSYGVDRPFAPAPASGRKRCVQGGLCEANGFCRGKEGGECELGVEEGVGEVKAWNGVR